MAVMTRFKDLRATGRQPPYDGARWTLDGPRDGRYGPLWAEVELRRDEYLRRLPASAEPGQASGKITGTGRRQAA